MTPTGEEIAQLIIELLHDIESKTCAPGEVPRVTPGKIYPHGFRPRFSLDNARIHVSAKSMLTQEGFLTPDRFISLPPYSGDIHKVIEQVHAVCNSEFDKELERLEEAEESIEGYQVMYLNTFYEKVTQQWIQASVTSLQSTFAQIILAGGAYPSKEFR